MEFTATLELVDKTATAVRVPAAVIAGLQAGKRPPVTATINGYTYRSTIAAYGNQFMLGVRKEVRDAAGVAAGDQVVVELELDTQPREVVAPPDFAEAIAAEPAAERFFEGLSYSNRRRIVMDVEEAKTPETRRRRITKAVQHLKEGRLG